MNYPSVKTITTRLGEGLRKEHGVNAESKAMIIRAYMLGGFNPAQVDLALGAINKIMGGYGVVALTDNGWDTHYCNCGVLYVNMGDTYCPTVCYDTRKNHWMISSWGDLVENNPRRFAS